MTDTTEAVACEVLRTAKIEANRTTLPMKASALLCVRDAEVLFNEGDFLHCRRTALLALQYSVGLLHEAYQKAEALTDADVQRSSEEPQA